VGTIRGTLDGAAPNTSVPNGARAFNGTFGGAGATGSSALRPVARRARPPCRGSVRFGAPGQPALGSLVQSLGTLGGPGAAGSSVVRPVARPGALRPRGSVRFGAPGQPALGSLVQSLGTLGGPGAAGSSVVRPVARPGALRPRGSVRFGAPGLAALADEVQYHVYANLGNRDPIDYKSPIATVSTTTWTSAALASPGTWQFGVRAFDANGEEQNLDCAVTVVLDSHGNDITNVPAPPGGLRAFATAGGSIRMEWWYPVAGGPKAPRGFHVYSGTGGIPNYATPAATVLSSAGLFNTYQANLAGFSDGIAYAIGVRAYNSSGEESNTTVVTVTADTNGPAAVSSLTAIAIV
jgi:hypothetical protein